MKSYIDKKVERSLKVLNKITCDVCDGNIIIGSEQLYYEVESSHNHWGNDSIESIKHFDLCSKKCLTYHFKNFMNDANSDGYSYEIETEKA